MKIVVIGGTGLIGDKVMTALDNAGHTSVAASRAFEIDAFTGEGLDGAMVHADAVIDVTNAPAWGDEYVLRFFSTTTRNALKAGRRAGVKHHVALSFLGCHLMQDSGYMRAKVAQEDLIRKADVPYTIVESTQFMEFLERVAQAGSDDDQLRVPDAEVQPIAAVDVGRLLATIATNHPTNGVLEIAGPEVFALDKAVATVLSAQNDGRGVVADPETPYFGARVPAGGLLPGPAANRAATGLADWLMGRRTGATVA
jgi:uncharacterized protein YbjT (DUF2867 family)